MDESEVIKAKIAKVENERDRAAARAVSLQKKVEELDVLLRHLNSWLEEVTKMKPGGQAGQSQNSGPIVETLRSYIKSTLQINRQFTTTDLVGAVRRWNPKVPEKSVMAEISILKKNGHVEWLDKGSYKSNLYDADLAAAKRAENEARNPRPPAPAPAPRVADDPEHDPFADTDLDDPFADEDNEPKPTMKGFRNAEPPPGFGRSS